MKKAKLFGLGAVALASVLLLGACGGGGGGTTDSSGGGSASGGDADHSVAIVTDIGGVDDRSFNQSAWEGLQAWGKEHKIERGTGGYDYIQSDNASQYTTNIDSAVSNGFHTIFGVGYLLADPISAAADTNPDTNFVIIDSVIEDKKNVVSATFKDNEAAYLAGVAAAHTTKTDKVGFIGGEEGVVIDRFEAGFVKGVEDTAKEMGKEIPVDVQYAASFGDPAKGKALAANMFDNDIDVIYHASGGTGNGVFSEAKARNEKVAADDKVWVIGVDSDQQNEGKYTDKDGNESNFCLTSTLKGVGAAVQDISTRALNDEFPGGEHLVFGLKDGGVSLTDGFLSDEAKTAVNEAKDKVSNGDVKVPEKP
ncbi:BMP family lipoprotein [Enterococcus pallens]|uniref:Basic membrane lipopprotein n=1 Tax=Enterococcus pallens ATCC BAA-351 TaxID=1158607 RepID=R2Q7U8_9ENTE|nr:BMP family protein [Enterococcus pallens]EOH91363.1 basic membrane lipopprotein [Enterococcus pallens ATCC BAA-351]EOU15981.1 basic membrane lipopprotein [Enterococcus pallens ATCC BAA-351]OJG78294.1 basic membrane lipopprotein [Enterococcus pallens]